MPRNLSQVLFLAAAIAVAAPAGARDAIYCSAEPGPRLLRIDLQDGNRVVVSGPVVAGVSSAFARMKDHDASLVYEQDSAAIFRVDRRRPRPVPVTGRALGRDFGFDYDSVGVLHDIATTANGRIFVTGHRAIGGPIVFEVDPANGDRRIVTGPDAGSGPTYGVYFECAAEGNDSLVVHNDVSAPKLLRVNANTGERTLLSGSSPISPFELHGAGPEFQAILGVDVAPDGSIYVLGYRGAETDGLAPSISRVDPATGDRSVVSNYVRGSGPIAAFDLAVVDDETILASGLDGTLLLVDIATGDRTVFSGGGAGSGPELLRADVVDYDRTTGLGYAYDFNLKILASVDLATGSKTSAWNNDAGSGPPLGRPTNARGLLAMAEEAPGRLLALGIREIAGDPPTASTFLMRIDLRDGARSIVADPATGAGPAIGTPGDVVALADGTIIVGDGAAGAKGTEGRLLRVDPASGDRTLLTPPGAPLFQFHDLEPDEANGVLYAAERLRLLRFDLATWAFEVLAEDPTGEGTELALESICLAPDGYLYGVHLVPEVTYIRFNPDTWEREDVVVQPGLVFPSSLTDIDASFAGRPIYKGPNSRLFRMILPDGGLREYGVPTSTSAFRPALNRAAAFAIVDDGEPVPGFAFGTR